MELNLMVSPLFGEIESVSCCKNRYILEGDFGAITVFADTTFIQPAPF